MKRYNKVYKSCNKCLYFLRHSQVHDSFTQSIFLRLSLPMATSLFRYMLLTAVVTITTLTLRTLNLSISIPLPFSQGLKLKDSLLSFLLFFKRQVIIGINLNYLQINKTLLRRLQILIHES